MSGLATGDFSKKTISALRKKGILLIGIQAVPDATGSFLNSERAYQVSDNGTFRLLSYLQVECAAK